MKFKYPYGDTNLKYPLFAGSPEGDDAASKFDTLILDATFNYGWTHSNARQRNFARFVTDQVTADLQNLASGGTQAPHGKYVHLYLNGLYWGLYDMHERPDSSFAAESYGGDKDDYYVVKSTNADTNHEYSYVDSGRAAEGSYQAGSPGRDGRPNGDSDADHDIDGADFLAWQRGLGKAAPTALPADGDAELDKDVALRTSPRGVGILALHRSWPWRRPPEQLL